MKKLLKLSKVKNIKHKIAKEFVRPTNVPLLVASTKKFRNITKWKPKKNFDDILIDTLEYWRDKVRNNEHI